MVFRPRATTVFLIIAALLAVAPACGAQEADASSSASPTAASAEGSAPALAVPSHVPARTWVTRVDAHISPQDMAAGVVPADRDAGRVSFSHSQHSLAGVDCITCHHLGVQGVEVQACASCHKGVEAVTVMHSLCGDCHRKRSSGPADCGGCHVGIQSTAAGIWRFDLYDTVRGPLFIAAWAIFAAGFGWRIFGFVRMTRASRTVVGGHIPLAGDDRAFVESGMGFLARALHRLRAWERGTVFAGSPVMARVSVVFHVLLFLVPLLLPAHNILFFQSFRVALPTLPEKVLDVLTLVLLGIGAFFLVRRIVLPRVRALTTLRDYLVLLLVAAPFVTAYMAYHQWLDYRSVLVTHMIIGEVVIATIPFTKLGHMPFLILSRFFGSGEGSWRPGRRRWTA